MDASDPLHLNRDAGVNRVHMVDLPGPPCSEQVKGHHAHELLASWGNARRVRAHLGTLGLPGLPDDPEGVVALTPSYLRALDVRVARGDTAAVELARSLGRSLAAVVAALVRGDEVNRAARPHWTPDMWTHWASVRHVPCWAKSNGSCTERSTLDDGREHTLSALTWREPHNPRIILEITHDLLGWTPHD